MLPESTKQWLLDSDPSIRWQVLRDFGLEPEATYHRERARVETDGWGALLLDRQRPDGQWGDDVHAPLWQSTLGALGMLKDLGLDPACRRARAAIERVHDHVTWGPEFNDSPFFDGEVEPCINGRALALGAYFGRPSGSLLERLIAEQLPDGGWNCEAERGSVRSSFHSTICVLEGLLEFEKACGTSAAITEARQRGEDYLLVRGLLRRLSTGEIIHDRKGGHDFTRFSFPLTWHYDVLRALDYFRAANARPDQRMAEAVDIIKSRKNSDGSWPLGEPYFDPIQFDMGEKAGEPSRWITLFALRVLNWYSR